MFSGIMYIMLLFGIILMIPEVILPYFPLMDSMEFKIIGVVIALIGVILYHKRCLDTSADTLTAMPNPKVTKCLHIGKSSGKILNAKKEEPNRLRAKTKRGWMNFKDMGNAINVAGHDFVVTTQDDGHTVPLWLCDAVSKWKKTFEFRNEDEFLKLYEKIQDQKLGPDKKGD